MSAYIYEALRTPRAKARPDGGLATLKPDELVAALNAATAERFDLNPSALILGAVGQVGAQGGNIALVSKFRSGLPQECFAWTLNSYCVSGLTAVNQAAAMILAGQADTVLAGGVEMMSRVPFMDDKADYYSDPTLPLEARYLPPVLAADRLAEDVGIDRAGMDAAALTSQSRAMAAEGTELNASRIAVAGLDRDECPRLTTPDSLAALDAAFAELAPEFSDVLGREVDHRHTIAHAPPVCDGAGLVLVGSRDAYETTPRARIVGGVGIGGDPAASLTAGFAAMEKLLYQTGMTLDQFDRIEFMEAFAVTIAKFYRDYPGLEYRVNVSGGHLAKGHPMGASGAILLSSLLDALDVAGGRFGLLVASGAAGVGSAMIVERLG